MELFFSCKNIIASFNPDKKSRILLASHWDSRPYADHDPNKENHKTPIDGANDGASGVGILIEVARQLSIKKPELGVDIVFWDIEDYGEPQGTETGKEDTWCIGTQHWAKNPHKQGYSARFGILLDMVGGKKCSICQRRFINVLCCRYSEQGLGHCLSVGIQLKFHQYTKSFNY
eukprot:TRINITY_DN23737_c0_g1_i2.p3 TRINITY_DN23737_c0_g1~~TRINITY_DN23737_c0_g1_i2.p3  ORF type:complete len:174 (+),score=13.52 TRINITY_DN23737_c0_g1_i2:413-934(+)